MVCWFWTENIACLRTGVGGRRKKAREVRNFMFAATFRQNEAFAGNKSRRVELEKAERKWNMRILLYTWETLSKVDSAQLQDIVKDLGSVSKNS